MAQLLTEIIACLEKRQPYEPTHNWPNAKKTYSCLCPFHNDTHVGSFGFHPLKGFHCFSCGASGSLKALADHLGLISDGTTLPETLTLYPPSKSPSVPFWTLLDPEKSYRPMSQGCRAYAHQRGLNDASLERWQIGYGQVPGTKCPYYRMILPVYHDGKLVDLRGRAITETDHWPKWLGAGGSHAALDGWDDLADARGKTVVLVEAPLSRRILMQQDSSIVAIAGTCGAGTWRDSWTEAIVRARPHRVMIWLDNDLAGMPNKEAYLFGLTRHLQKSPTVPVPIPNGKKRAIEFQEAGLIVQTFPWPPGTPYGADPCSAVSGVV